MLVKATARKRICLGEEAAVSRISTRAYPFNQAKDLVERKTRHLGRKEVGQTFEMASCSRDGVERVLIAKRQTIEGEVLSYHSLRVAKELFPENFQKVLGMRISGDGKSSCIYSKFVPDTTGTIERKTAGKVEFHKTRNEKKRDFLVGVRDIDENMRCRSLGAMDAELWNAGITVPHPQMNYHFDGKSVVFFEVIGARLDRLARAILALPEGSRKTKASVHFGLLVAAMLRVDAEKNLQRACQFHPEISQTILNADLARAMVSAATRTGFVVEGRRYAYKSPPLLLYFRDAPARQESLRDHIYSLGEGINAFFMETLGHLSEPQP